MFPLKLREWQKSPRLELTREEIADLSKIRGLRIDATSDGRFEVIPTGNFVGYARRGEVSVMVQPSKCKAEQVIAMMSYSTDPRVFGQNQVQFKAEDDILEAYVATFVRTVARAIEQGLFKSYMSLDEDVAVIRGRIRVSDQITTKFRMSPPIAVNFDEYTIDNSLNRVIKYAIEVVSRIPIRLQATVKNIQYLRAMFNDVSLLEMNSGDVSVPIWNQLNDHLKPSFIMANQIIENSSISLDIGKNSSDEFWIDMANVFEDFVVVAIRESLGLGRAEMPRANELNRALQLSNKVFLKPDISRWQDGSCIAIGDVKYKRTSEDGIVYSDIYQLLAYAVATGLDTASLVYAKSIVESEGLYLAGNHYVEALGIEIKVFVLDLDRPFIDVLQQIAVFAKNFEPNLLNF
jgi:5-methylcytosine-specific restriction enzyme subunit McrC